MRCGERAGGPASLSDGVGDGYAIRKTDSRMRGIDQLNRAVFDLHGVHRNPGRLFLGFARGRGRCLGLMRVGQPGQPPFAIGILRPDDARAVKDHGAEDEFAAEEREEAVIGMKGFGLDLRAALLGHGNAGHLQAAPRGDGSAGDLERETKRFAELRLDPQLDSGRLDVKIDADDGGNDDYHQRNERDENSLGKSIHAAQPTRRVPKEKGESAPPRMTEILLILNPAARSERAGNATENIRRLVDGDARIVLTRHAGEAKAIALEAARERGADRGRGGW